MSRSRKKQPFVREVPVPAKEAKTEIHKRVRHEEHIRLRETLKTAEFDEHLTTLPQEVMTKPLAAKLAKVRIADDSAVLRK